MTANAGQDFWHEQADDPEVRIDARVHPDREDAYWQRAYWAQPYHRDEYGYDDYAPAYCVGYIGYAQYGGCFEDAEKSLCANWVRIKGDSRLEIDVAMQAIRAAWEHAALGTVEREEDEFEQELAEEFFAATPRAEQQRACAVA
jgi:hypothetical protein